MPHPGHETVALLGASSRIAKDLIKAVAAQRPAISLQLYVRDLGGAERWLQDVGLTGRYPVYDYGQYGRHYHAAVINFVGAGDPVKTARIGEAIFGITQRFDDLVLDELRRHPDRRYIFLSSGAAYGTDFREPAGPASLATIPLNALRPEDLYGAAKLHAECKHRALPDLCITDLRVFNYFSRSQDLSARFLITDVLRSIRDDAVLETSPDEIVRDYLHPSDFFQLVERVLISSPHNRALDCYTREPVKKQRLLDAMQQEFGLKFRIAERPAGLVEATGAKRNYYSLNRWAAEIGYEPAYSSLEGVTIEAGSILGRPPRSMDRQARA